MPSQLVIGLAVWPIVLFLGSAVWYFGKSSGQGSDIARLEGLVAEHGSRLVAVETNATNQGRQLDRIEGKLDRVLEGRHA